jgi:putative isomerase
MMQRTRFINRERLGEIYRPLGRWTDWWLRHNDSDGDGIPDYAHGNDSGWDNCTAFDIGTPLEAPDLSAYLVIQMDVLSQIAHRLGRRAEAARWKARADELLARLIQHSWRGDGFVAPRSGDHRVSDSDTLLAYVPIVLGKRLPDEIRRKLLAGLKDKGRFLTRHGLATESPRSRHYRSDGYWRGPIWAPATLLIVDGLAACGERGLARSIARRFCNLCAAGGMAENFDALTGRGLRDRAYTWTASVFLILAHEYLC